MKHLNITVLGLVQGVGFRHSAKWQAIHLGINGYVQNKTDGSVYIEAEGDSNALAEFVAWCRKGLSFAEVTEIIVKEGEMKNYSSFDTAY